MSNTLYTIGFTKKSAEEFFNLLKNAGVKKVIDIRLHPGGQLSGFAKARDLEYFLKTFFGIGYEYREEFVTEPELLQEAREKRVTHQTAMRKYLQLIKGRNISIDREELQDACLLCSEADYHHCHRQVLAEYLAGKYGLKVVHL